MHEHEVDFLYRYEGTLSLLTPQTERADVWVETHIDPNAETLGKAVVIEHRYVAPILEGIHAHGLTVGEE